MASSNVAGSTGKALVAGGLVALFLASRIALLITSYDANSNWEEPVFLFSAGELARDGIGQVFDHQDDLDHGGSVLLLLLAVPWLTLTDSGLPGLKGVSILWSALTLCALMGVAWRYFSPRTGLLLGAFFTILSPTIARLNITLVGSHPEAVLPSVLALAAYLEWARRDPSGAEAAPWLAALTGLLCGIALWTSYLSATFVFPLLLFRGTRIRVPRAALALLAGLLAGALPWFYQNLWLRPHGALQWMQHLSVCETPPTPGTTLVESSGVLTELVESFGLGEVTGAAVAALGALSALAFTAALLRPAWRKQIGTPSLALAPILAAPVLGLGLVAILARPMYPDEGYFHYRFFALLQVALFWNLALALDRAAVRAREPVAALVAGLLLAGCAGQARLYGAGNHYDGDVERDRVLGCSVFALAEWDRADDRSHSVAQLARLHGWECRDQALRTFGGRLSRQALADGELDELVAFLRAVRDTEVRRSLCAGAAYWLHRIPPDDRHPRERNAATAYVSRECAGAPSAGNAAVPGQGRP